MVELSRVDRPEAVPGAIASGLGFPTFEVLLGAPLEQSVVVLIDNCEHVGDAAAAAVSELLDAWATVTVVATSRSPLALPEESIVVLAPLPVPAVGAADGRTGAVRLFCDRARDGGVEIGDDEIDLVTELCRRLDGMPLAIELAAARLRVLGVGDLARRVGEGVDVLARKRHRGDARHRSVYDTIVWSSRLLDEADRTAFTRLGVCAGPFESDMAAAVVGCPLSILVDVMERLVDASLVTVEREGPDTRYRMLEPIRAVALDELDQAGLLDDARERLATHVYDVTAAMISESLTRWAAELLPTLIGRFEQIDIALRHCLAHDGEPTRALLLYGGLWGIVHQARVDEVLALGEAVVDRWPDTSVAHGADAAATYAMSALLCGQTEEARRIAFAALPDTGASVLASSGLRRILGLAARIDGDHQQAEAMLAEAAEHAAEQGIVTVDLECRVYRAQDLATLGRHDEALEIVRTVAELAHRNRSIINEVWARTVEASILGGRGDEGAMDIASATLLLSRAIAYPFGIICNLQTLAAGHLRGGDLAGAAEVSEQLLDAVSRSGSGDFRRALDVATAVLAAAGHAAAPQLAATAQRLPDTNPMIVRLPAVTRPTAIGPVLDRPSATRMARRSLNEVQARFAVGIDADGLPADAACDSTAALVRSGDLWEVRYDGLTVHLPPSKGMDDLAVLLSRPGREVHCLELAGAALVEATTGEMIDARARRQYEDRIRVLYAEAEDADADHDLARAERARAELDALVDQLTSAFGLAGRTRRQGGTTERARSMVTHRLRAATRRIAAVHPGLGRHLAASLTTGTYCRYQPERPVVWST